jgi:beta-glucosidase
MDRVHRQRAPPDRVMFLRARLGQLQRATSDGVPVDDYFLWSAQDNL